MKPVLVIPSHLDFDREDVVKWSDTFNKVVMFLNILGVHQRDFDFKFKHFTTRGETNFAVDPTGVGTNGKKITRIMAKMCNQKEFVDTIATLSDQIVETIKPNQQEIICLFSKDDHTYNLNFFVFTCEKKTFGRDITLAFRHREGWFGFSLTQKVLETAIMLDKELEFSQ